MKTSPPDAVAAVAARAATMTGGRRRTPESTVRHPSAGNLEGSDAAAPIGDTGEASEKANSAFAFDIAGERHIGLRRRRWNADAQTPRSRHA
ncbi:hypothetical protein DFR50_101281 [Roseiarcus fermentans]|uniref:Uncharacterized protein n=1 Tax=Roseiarcus fermentans TaxID=1473586 RepID=A0A366FW21_9HYPH|nr:hypothetical protein DFR50_101281 [Roseiarcus fermentans]